VGAAQQAADGTPAGIATANFLLGAVASPNYHLFPASSGVPLFGLTDQPTANNGDLSYRTTKDSGVTWRLVARYAMTDDANVYASYARGRRPPVQSAGSPAVPGDAPSLYKIAAEKVDAYEVGAKGVFLNRRLFADVSAYAYRYSHFQTVTQQGVQFVSTDAGLARAYGVEAQVAWNPIDSLQLYGTYAFNHARLKSGAYAGNHFRLSPDNTFSLAAVWTLPVLGGDLSIRPSYTWQSREFFSDNNDRPELQQPPATLVADNVQDELQKSFGLANLRVSWTPPGAAATIEVFATNLFDKKYIIDAGNTGDSFGLPTFIAGPPRVVGAGVSYRFK
jgi:outer membrane receptor protein involved in Fe transport